MNTTAETATTAELQDIDTIVLTPPQPVAAVAPETAASMVPLDEATRAALEAKVQTFTEVVVAEDPHSDAFKAKVDAIHNLGMAEIQAASAVSHRMLDRPMAAMNEGLFDDGSAVSKSLIDLRRTVEDLDPSTKGDLLSPRKLLGFIPWGSNIEAYFRRYQSAQSHLNAIIQALYNGQDELRKDNAAIEQEKANLWQTMGKLEQFVYLGKQLDEALESRIAVIEAQSPEKARVVKEEMLFYVRQKVQDLLTQLAVSVQGYLALDMIRKNNLELIKGVDRATTTTVSALRTAVIVSQALANQKLVLDQISALNTTTANMIAGTSELLKQQSAGVHAQASSSTVELDKLKQAFANIYETMDMVADYKVQALGSMKQTVESLSSEVEKARTYVDRVRQGEAAASVAAATTFDADGTVRL